MIRTEICPICSNIAAPVGSRKGRMDGRQFSFRSCEHCGFSYVENYRTDFADIYDENYYRGLGGDPTIDYVYESANPSRTIRVYEYQGILKIFRELCPSGGKWLDFGCGNGGLVQYALAQKIDIVGMDEGWGAEIGRAQGVPILARQDLAALAGSFDFVTAIEVLEHTSDPMAELQAIRSLLKPGGTLFLTTGNAASWKDRLLDWPYTSVPDVHISFFEPRTIAYCMQRIGLVPQNRGYLRGYDDVIKYKILKNLGFKRRRWLASVLPWRLLSRLADRRYGISGHPVGIAVDR